MRICPISVAQPITSKKHLKQANLSQSATQLSPTFKGWKAGLGALVGTGLGAAAGIVLSGGLLTPLILAEVGTLGGAIYGSSKEDPGESYDDSDPDWHRYD